MYYKGAECAIIAYDVTNRESFEQAKLYWVSEVENQLGKNPCLCLAANKADLVSERVVSEEEGMAFAHSRSLSYFETSAKTDQNVSDMFQDIAGRLPSQDGTGFDRTNTYSLGTAVTRPVGPTTNTSKVFNFCC
jgi:Ras-related protein Rab-5C